MARVLRTINRGNLRLAQPIDDIRKFLKGENTDVEDNMHIKADDASTPTATFENEDASGIAARFVVNGVTVAEIGSGGLSIGAAGVVNALTIDGVENDGVTDIGASLTTYLATLSAAGGGTVYFPKGAYRSTTQITVPSNTTIEGDGRATVFHLYGGSNVLNLFSVLGSAGATADLASNTTEGVNTVVLVAGSVVALGLNAGDYVWIKNASTGFTQISRIVSIATETLTISDPIYESFTTAGSSTVQKITAKSGTVFRDLALNGQNNTGNGSCGIVTQYATDCEIENVYAERFDAGCGVKVTQCYATLVRGLRLYRCGDGGDSDFELNGSTGCIVDGLFSDRSGFGPSLAVSNGCTVSNVRSTRSSARAFKLGQSSHNLFSNIHAHTGSGGSTGFSLAGGSRHNIVHGLDAMGSSSSGLWLEGTGDDSHNQFRGVRLAGNGAPQLSFGANADDNTFDGSVTGTITNAGERNTIRLPGFGRTKTVVGTTNNPTTSSASLATLDEMTMTFPTTGGDVEVELILTVSNSSAGGGGTFGVTLGGGGAGQVSQSFATAAETHVIVARHTYTNISAGDQTITGQWARGGSGTLTAATTQRSLTAREVARS